MSDPKLDAAYARQGMQKVNTGLGNLFSEAPDEDEEEALVYRRPKDPALARASLPPSASKPAAPVTVTAAPKNAPEYVLVASVPALFHLNPATGGYESKSNAQVGCVIVGSGAAYQLLFYDTSKVTLTSTQITAEMNFGYQPNAAANYVTFTNAQGTWSVGCSSPAQAQEILKNLTVTLVHTLLHTNSIPATPVLCTVEAGTGSHVIEDGDDVALSYSLMPLTTVVTAKPTDIMKQPPIASNVAQAQADFAESVFVTAGASKRGLAYHALGCVEGQRKWVVVSLSDLIAAKELEGDALVAAVAASTKAQYVLAEVNILRVTPKPAPAPAPAPVVSSAEPASTALVLSNHSDSEDYVAHRKESDLRERMAKVALGALGKDHAVMPVIASIGSNTEVHAQSLKDLPRQRRSSAASTDEHEHSTHVSTPAPAPAQATQAPAPAVATETTATPPATPAAVMAPQPSAFPQTPQFQPSPYAAGMGFFPPMYPPMPFMPPAFASPYHAPSQPSATPSARDLEAVAESVKSVSKTTDVLSGALAALDYKMDKLLQASLSQFKLQMVDVPEVTTDLNGRPLTPEEAVLTGAKIPELLRQLTNLMGAATRMQQRVAEKNDKIDELRGKIEDMNQEQERLLGRLDSATTLKNEAVREATLLRADKGDLESQVAKLQKRLAETTERAERAENDAAQSKQAAADAQGRADAASARAQAAEDHSKQLTEQLDDTRQQLADARAEIASKTSELQAEQAKNAQLQQTLQATKDSAAREVAALRAQAEKEIADLLAREKTTKATFRAEATAAIEKASAASLAQGHAAGYSEGHEAGLREGKSQGFEEGRVEGHKAGVEEGLRRGEEAGYHKGHSVGFAAGEDAGFQRGVQAGHATGYALGREEGYNEGLSAATAKAAEAVEAKAAEVAAAAAVKHTEVTSTAVVDEHAPTVVAIHHAETAVGDIVETPLGTSLQEAETAAAAAEEGASSWEDVSRADAHHTPSSAASANGDNDDDSVVDGGGDQSDGEPPKQQETHDGDDSTEQHDGAVSPLLSHNVVTSLPGIETSASAEDDGSNQEEQRSPLEDIAAGRFLVPTSGHIIEAGIQAPISSDEPPVVADDDDVVADENDEDVSPPTDDNTLDTPADITPTPSAAASDVVVSDSAAAAVGTTVMTSDKATTGVHLFGAEPDSNDAVLPPPAPEEPEFDPPSNLKAGNLRAAGGAPLSLFGDADDGGIGAKPSLKTSSKLMGSLFAQPETNADDEEEEEADIFTRKKGKGKRGGARKAAAASLFGEDISSTPPPLPADDE